MASAPSVQHSGDRSVGPTATDRPSRTVAAAPLLVGFESSLSTVPLDRLERTAREMGDPWLGDGYDRIEGTQEVALLATCCRRELWLLAQDPDAAAKWRARLPGPGRGWRARYGREAIQHLFRVAGGCESLAFGEKEVRAQVRASARHVLSRHRLRVLKDLFEGAVSAAERAAPVVPESRSIAAIAVDRLLELCEPSAPKVVVIGGGAVGRQVLQRLASRARVTLVYRDRRPDDGFLRLYGVRAVRAEKLRQEAATADAVVTAIKSGVRCLAPDDLPGGRALVVVDLGVPRNVDPRVRGLPNVRLLDLDDLRTATPPAGVTELGMTLLAEADAAYERFERLAVEPWIASARRGAEAARAAELSAARPFLGPLSRDQEVAVDRLTRRLVERLLRSPTDRIRQIPAGPEGDRLRRFAVELLQPSAT